MWVKIDLGTSNSAGNSLGAVGGAPSSKIVGKILGLIIRRSHGRYSSAGCSGTGESGFSTDALAPGDVIRTPPRTNCKKGLCRGGSNLCTNSAQSRALEKTGRRENVWPLCDPR